MSSIAIVTIAAGDEYQQAVRPGTESKQAYCARHGYDFVLRTEPIEGRPIAWGKIPLLAEVIEHYDYVFWSDADVVITNPSISLEQIVGEYPRESLKTVLITKDSAGNVNTGNFFLFNEPAARIMLDMIWQQYQFIDHAWWENKAFIHLYETNPWFAAQVLVEAERPSLFNAYTVFGQPELNYRPGDFLIHFAGVHDLQQITTLMHTYSNAGISGDESTPE